MTAAERAHAYLAITPEYGLNLGGFVWSHSGDAIERWNGTTFAFAEEIREVLAGVFARTPVPPFDFVLVLLRCLRDGPETSSVAFDRLWTAYTSAKGSTSLLRNCGLLISELCRTLPSVNAPASDIAAVLGQRHEGDRVMPESSPLPRREFEARIESRLEQFDDARLLHWLKFGCDPLGGAEQLAEPLDTLPVRVEKLLARARREPRLSGAASLVPALDGALTLPARRRSPDAVPQGGYCDVTTRGEPERVLPTQFALERDEFIRRFAERELLYFQREEPHATRRPERLIVLDQGVRTWGGVRLALAAAALVFMRKEAKRVGRVRFATTSAPWPVDVQAAEVDSLVTMLESSDLTAAPDACLLSALEPSDSADARDVVVLTHARAMWEAGVQRALAERAAIDRVFVLAVDDGGAAELMYWREAGPDSVRRFRTDLRAALAVGIPAEPRPAAPFDPREWTGDVEPVAFPFRPGLVATPEHLGFDTNGSWLVAASRNGMLQGFAADSTPPEVLPRAYRDSVVMQKVEAVLGVPGGVAVCGRLPASTALAVTLQSHGQPVMQSSASDSAPLDRYVVARYDRNARNVRVYEVGPCVEFGKWSAHPELNCVSLALPNVGVAAVDFGTHEVRTGPDKYEAAPPRIELTRKRARDGRSHPPYELLLSYPESFTVRTRVPTLRIVANGLVVEADGASHRLMPMQDGKFLLEGAAITRALLASDTLALALKRGGERRLVTLHYRENRILAETRLASAQDLVALSCDGRTIAFTQARSRSLAIASVGDLGSPAAEARHAALHDKVQVGFGDRDALQIGIGQFLHSFEANAGILTHQVRRGLVPGEGSRLQHTDLGSTTKYDSNRFLWREGAIGRDLLAIADRFGQVVLHRKSGSLVAHFMVRRERAAAWIPGGMFWGDPSLIGGPATPGAAERIGAELARKGTP